MVRVEEKTKTYLLLSFSKSRSLECSHSIRPTAISHVSVTTSTSPSRSRNRLNKSSDSNNPIAPSASAASCRHIGSSSKFSSTASRYGTADSRFVWPRQYASSCLSKADGDANPAAIASTAASARVSESASALAGTEATCLSEKRARNRRASGVDSETRIDRSSAMVSSVGAAVVIVDIREESSTWFWFC